MKIKKEVIVEAMFRKPSASREGNYIKEGIYGRPEYYIDGDIIREKNQFGKPAYIIDGNYIREGMYGKLSTISMVILYVKTISLEKWLEEEESFNHSFK